MEMRIETSLNFPLDYSTLTITVKCKKIVVNISNKKYI